MMPPSETRIQGVSIRRDAKVELHPFVDYFHAFETLPCVREIFGARTEEILRNLKVEFNSFKWGYMGVSDVDGHLFVSTHYLANGEDTSLYLDIVHELVHVRQFLEGKNLFDHSFQYVDRPTEIEAYGHAVKEARRLGLSDAQIFEYLKTEWISEGDHRRLAAALGIQPPLGEQSPG